MVPMQNDPNRQLATHPAIANILAIRKLHRQGKDMELSPGEKIIIAMLADIKNHLDIDGNIDHQFVENAIFNNHLWAIAWQMPGMNFPKANTPPHVSEVVDILDMWEVVERSFEGLDQAERDDIENNDDLYQPRFVGFDGNNETKYMSVARFFVNDMDRFQRFHGRDFNSHLPCVSRYLDMVSAFKACGRDWLERQPAGLTKDEIIKILSR